MNIYINPLTAIIKISVFVINPNLINPNLIKNFLVGGGLIFIYIFNTITLIFYKTQNSNLLYGKKSL